MGGTALDFWVVCTKCGAGHSFEDFALQDPDKVRAFSVRELPRGAEENNIETIWVPRCKDCGSDTFHVQLDPEDMIEVWEKASQSELALQGTPDRTAGLRVWRERAEQQDQEFQAWRARHRKRRQG